MLSGWSVTVTQNRAYKFNYPMLLKLMCIAGIQGARATAGSDFST